MKLLAWAILIFAVIWVLRSKAKARAKSQAAARQSQTAQPFPASLPETEAMVSCAQCGLHFPASEAVQDADSQQNFCSIEHRQLHLGR